MLACDTSALIAYLADEKALDTLKLDEALQKGLLHLPAMVMTEILSAPIPLEAETLLRNIPILEITEGFWERTGILRRTLLARKLKARTMDCLIAQSCIDANVPLITRDADFKHFANHAGLKLA